MKECIICHKIKPLDEFHKHPKAKDGHNPRCKQCQNEYNKRHVQISRSTHCCKNCGKYVHWSRKYCSDECRTLQKCREKTERDNIVLNEWLNNDLSNCIVKSGPQVGELRSYLKDRVVKPYLLEEQNHHCAICNCTDMHNNKPLIFILDHIDGDWSNNYKNNFRLICPNCNSQLGTTKNNKGKGRYSARLYQKQHRDTLR